MGTGEGPGHKAAPVVADEDEFLAWGKMIGKRANVFDQTLRRY